MPEGADGQGLHGLPAIERILVVRGEEEQVLGRDVATSLIGAEKPRKSEGTGRAGDAGEHEVCAGLVSWITPRTTARPSCERKRQIAPVAADQADRSGITIGSFIGWPGVGGTLCATSSR